LGGSFGLAAMMPATPDLDGRLLAGEQQFIKSFSGPHPRENDIDIMARLQAGKPDYALRQVRRLTGLPMLRT